jgi:hypothetical protein
VRRYDAWPGEPGVVVSCAFDTKRRVLTAARSMPLIFTDTW